MMLLLPFSSKAMPDGKRLFRRKYGYVFTQIAGTSTHEITVPYTEAKINEVEFIDSVAGCSSNLKILDTAAGTYSGVPNYVLNQFGFDVNIQRDYYKDISQYDADVFTGMRIVIEFTSPSAFSLRVNIVFHELKV